MQPLAIMAICLLMLRQGQSQAVGQGTEDVWVDGQLGGKVELGCEEEEEEVEVEGGGCPPHCVWNGPQGVFLVVLVFVFTNQTMLSYNKVFSAALRLGRRGRSVLGASPSLIPTGREWICQKYQNYQSVQHFKSI